MDLSKKVMAEIKTKKIKMRPKIYFVFGSLLLGFGLSLAIFLAVFFMNIIYFHFRMRVFYFPWSSLGITIISLLLGLMLLRKYDFSYRKSFFLLTLILTGIVFFLSFVLNVLRLNERARRIRHFQPFYRERIFERKPGPRRY